jgi:hypothetical protein
MELITVVFVIFLVAALLAWITKINIAFLFAPSIFLIALWEFIFGLSGFLNLGMETLVLFSCSTTLILLIKSVQFRASILRNLYLPSTIAFFLLATISFLKSKDWVLYQWDEFTHWGHVVRIMYKYAELGPGTPTDYAAENYPPALSLFQYFVIDFSSGWREGLLYWSLHLIVISIIVSVLAKCSYKNFAEIILKLFVALVASLAFLNNFDTIYADPTLAITFGFLIVIAINASFLDGRWALIFAASSAFATLIKPIGIYLALSAILINIVATLFTLKFESIKKVIVSFRPALTSLATVGAAWMAWGYYLSSLSSASYSLRGGVPNAFNSSGREEFVSGVTSSFTRALFQTGLNPISWSNMPASKWTIVCILFFAIWMYLNGRDKIRRNFAIGITLFATSAGYLAVLLYSYLTVFGPGEAAGLASFSRYVATWYQGVFFAIVLLILSELNFGDDFKSNLLSDSNLRISNTKRRISILLITFMALNTVSSIGLYVNLLRSPQFKGSEWREPFAPMIKAIKEAGIPEGSKVYIITQHKIGWEFYVLRYELIGAQFGEMPFSIGTPYGEGDNWTEPTMTVDRWSKTLRDFDFVVLYITTESFNKEYSSLFKGGVVEANTVYKVEKLAKTVVLSKAS